MRVLLLTMLCAMSACAQGRAQYVGGTASKIDSGTSGAIDVSDAHYFAFYARKAQVRVDYKKIDTLEYGQKVDRRLMMAVIISPIFLLSKSRQHFLTVGYVDEEGGHQALVFRVDKNGIRATLASLEARTGVRIEFQDEEARKAGKE